MPEQSKYGKSHWQLWLTDILPHVRNLAGAIQDYQRGIIIGHKTFGKGTVQKLDDLSSGQIKITESKFYRITGSGMQSKGIHPDIILPTTWDIEQIGESSYNTALPWDEIKPVRFKNFYGIFFD